jgi:uncharacterized OB-fold protein
VSDSAPARSPVRPRAPVREGLLMGSLDDLAGLRLAGSRCSTCGETSFGVKDVCPNCGQATLKSMALSAHGVLWSFTVVRHRPPGDYRGPDPFAPFGLGLVELPDGVRVLSPIECRLEELRIGMELRFRPYLRHDQERDIVVFAFEPIAPGAGHG